MSGGEKQKAALAVLFAMNPSVYLLDEPFASIDRKSRLEILGILKELVEAGKTIILCDHDLSDYEAYIDHMVELRNDEVKKIFKIPSSETREVFSKEVGNCQDLFHLKQMTCILNDSPLFSITDFTFYEGVSCILGDNGVGKSTLFRSILQFQKYKGKIRWKNRLLKKKKSLYDEITYVVQEADKQFIRASLKKELQLDDLDNENDKRVKEVLQLFDLENSLDKSPYQLSGGQQKMVQLLTIMTNQATVVLLDEPFAGLDDRACDYVCRWIREECQKGRSFLIISHRLDPLVSLVDYWIEMTSTGLKYLKEVSITRPLRSRGIEDKTEVR